MTTLKVIKNRIRSVTNTKKITQSMKIVSASKYVRAQEDLKSARPMGEGVEYFYEEIEVVPPVEIDSQLIVALSSDNGLCGAIHSGIAKIINANIANDSSLGSKTKLICIGEYVMSILSRTHPEKVIWAAKHIGKKAITFSDAAIIALKINECIAENNFAITKIYYNKFLSNMRYKADVVDLYNKNSVTAGKSFPLYDEIDDEILESYLEFSCIVLIYRMMKEGACSELAARIIAMGNATKNASNISEELKREYNRTRQTAITGELIEIISGAHAVSE